MDSHEAGLIALVVGVVLWIVGAIVFWQVYEGRKEEKKDVGAVKVIFICFTFLIITVIIAMVFINYIYLRF